MQYVVREYKTNNAVFITDDSIKAKVMLEIMIDKTNEPHVIDCLDLNPSDAIQQESKELQIKYYQEV